VTTTLIFGDLRSGRIVDTLDVTGCSWQQVKNDAGAIDGVTVEAHEVAAKALRAAAPATRAFLAIDVDGRLQEAGPIWSRVWDDKAYQLTLGASGLWSIFDHRKVLPVLAGTVATGADLGSTTVAGTDLGGIARALVAQALTHVGGDLPLVLPPAASGTRTETFPGWKLQWVGDQLRELTRREVSAPDIRFRPRYTADRLGVEWVMEHGSEDQPLLAQAGEDWFFDASVPKGPVVNIHTDDDATIMAQRAWVTGEGSEEDTLVATAYNPALIDAGWPLLEADEARSTVSQQGTLQGHAENLRDRSARPIEVWKVVVRAEAAAEVLAGDYCRVIPERNHPWLPAGEAYMRVKSKSGDLGDNVTLVMYAVAAVL
jgi:hypothetical protein